MKSSFGNVRKSLCFALVFSQARLGWSLSTVAAPSTKPLADYLPPLENGSQRLYLCRHGETDWNVQGRIQGGGYDVPLNDNGRRQAQLLAAALHDVKLDVVASSDLERADETADMIYRSQAYRRPRRIISGKLKEMRFGDDWEGVVWKERASAFQQVNEMINKHRHLEWPNGGESTEAVAKRAEHAVLNQVLDDDGNNHVCCVAHGRVNRILLEHFLDTDCLPKQVNAGINVLDRCPEGKWTLRVYNYRNHLLDE